MSSPRWQITATPTEHGRVEYTVGDAGAVTIAWGTSFYPQREDDQYVEARWGRWRDKSGWPLRDGQVLEDALTINRVTLAGSATVDLDKLRECTDGDHWSPWWIHVTRWVTRNGMPRLDDAPDRTRATAAALLAHLIVEDFTIRPDAGELLAAHRQWHAPERIALHEREAAHCHQQVDAWQAFERRHVERARWHRQWADGQDPAPLDLPALPHHELTALAGR